MARSIQDKMSLAERMSSGAAQVTDYVQSSQAWSSIFRPGSVFRKGYTESQGGFGGLVGVRLGTGDVLSIRLDGTLDYISSAESKNGPFPLLGIEQADNNVHLGMQAGLSLLLGNKRDGDRDRERERSAQWGGGSGWSRGGDSPRER